jgi:nucleoside deoxyribosyltransferase
MNEYLNNGRTKVYLAGPFFNEEQEERISYIENLLDTLNFDVFSPRKASKITKGCSQDDMLDTFRGNVTHIDDADFVLAILDGNDAGTLFECGYAFANQVPTLYFNETRPSSVGPNLMLALSTDLPFVYGDGSRDTLNKTLSDISTLGVERTIADYDGNVFDEVE